MKTSHRTRFLGVAALSLASLSGCGARTETPPPSEIAMDTEAPAFYSLETGLVLSPISREAAGIHTVAVRKATFTQTFTTRARFLPGSTQTRPSLHAIIPREDAPRPGAGVLIHIGEQPIPARGPVRIESSYGKIGEGIELLVGLSDEQAAMMKDLRCTISYPVGQERTSASIPTGALVRAALGDFVYVEANGGYHRHRVKVGEITDQSVEILQGLKEDDRVVEKGSDRLWILELALVGGMSHLESAKEAH